MKKILGVIFVLLFFAQSAQGSDILQRENEAQKRVDSVRAALSDMPNTIERERANIMRELDKWSAESLPRIIERHYSDVEAALDATTLPSNLGNLSVYWSQLKAGATLNWLNEDLAGIIRSFENRAKNNLNKPLENFQDEISASLAEAAKTPIENAQNRIKEKFSDELRLLGMALPTPNADFADIARNSTAVTGSVGGLVGIAGIVLIFSRKILSTISRRLGAKVFGKAMTKLIPFIGMVLIAIDIWDAASARATFERDMRKGILDEYKLTVTADEIWRGGGEGSGAEGENADSMRREFEKALGETLTSWERACKKQAEAVLNIAAISLTSPSVKNYIDSETQKGIALETTANRLAELRAIFGTLVHTEPIETLENIHLLAQNKTELSALVKGLDKQFLELYEKNGMVLLEIVNAVGAENFMRHRADIEKIGLARVSDAAHYYPYIKDDPRYFDALMLLLENRVPLDKTVFPKDALMSVARYPQLVGIAYSATGDVKFFTQIFQSEKSLQNIADTMKQNPKLTEFLLKNTSPAFWNRGDVRAIFEVAKFAPESTVSQIINDEDNEILNVYKESGIEGVKLWLNFVKENAGENAKKTARRAVALYDKGFPPEELTTVDAVNLASLCDWSPLGGQWLFSVTSHLGRTGRFIFMILGAGFSILIAYYFYLRLWRMKKNERA